METSDMSTGRAASRMPSVSVIVCTYDRAALLGECLDSIARQDRGDIAMEIIVVDNNSSDGTRAIVEGFSARVPELRYVSEPRQGLAIARNTGARLARHDYLAFIDDDATLRPGYLRQLGAIIDAFRPDLIGGPVVPRFEDEPPNWFDPKWELREHQTASGFAEDTAISGGNFIVRRDVFVAIGPFPERLGMAGGRAGFGEDRALVEIYRQRTPKGRRRIYYSAELAVDHFTASAKLNKRYQLRRRYLNARTREQIFVATGKRSAGRSLLLGLGRVALSPATALGRFAAEGVSRRTRFGVTLGLADSLGRCAGALGSMFGNRLLLSENDRNASAAS
jgi:glycosyltransferase involved in cell wall biosynthesis